MSTFFSEQKDQNQQNLNNNQNDLNQNKQDIIQSNSLTWDKDYWAQNIKVLEWLEPVRQRPGMYIWTTDSKWVHHMVQEIIDNSVDEALAWFCKNITTILHKDNYISVFDDWRWIPVDIHEKTKKSAVETVFTVLHAWWKFEKWVYKVSWWLHWVWASVVNALSEELIVNIHRNWKLYSQKYARWIPQSQLEVVWETDKTWTTVIFKPDDTIFDDIQISYQNVLSRMKHSAYLLPWISFTLIDELNWFKQRFYFENWLKIWIKKMIWEHKICWKTYYMKDDYEDLNIEFIFWYIDNSYDNLISFVNNIQTSDWWHHVNWFKSALLTFFNEIVLQIWEVDKKLWEFVPNDITDWLYWIINLKMSEPQFEWQTKWRLWNSYVKKIVESYVYNKLKELFNQNKEEFIPIVERIKLSAKARIAAKLAKETVLRKTSLISWVLPWKLVDCTLKWKKNTELFIVEWNSAGWSAKQGRDSYFQAILPLRWKILNTEQINMQKLLANNEIKSLIISIWTALKENYDSEKLRYEKIIIMTDADVDGAHIRTLLLTFFFRYMRNLIEDWHLFVAVPPLYKLKQWSKELYIYPPNDDLNLQIAQNWFDPNKVDIQRYKWLWEMNANQLWDTTMNPENRKMLKVNIADWENADRLFRILMWDDVLSRKNFILTHAKNVKALDI